MEWTPDQLAELTGAVRRHPKPGVRWKAGAVLAVAKGHTRELAAELCGPVFSRTTGAQIPLDGGNERVI